MHAGSLLSHLPGYLQQVSIIISQAIYVDKPRIPMKSHNFSIKINKKWRKLGAFTAQIFSGLGRIRKVINIHVNEYL
jgi:hypothetical protein